MNSITKPLRIISIITGIIVLTLTIIFDIYNMKYAEGICALVLIVHTTVSTGIYCYYDSAYYNKFYPLKDQQ